MQQKRNIFATSAAGACAGGHMWPYLRTMEHTVLATVSETSSLSEWLSMHFDRQAVELLMAQHDIGADRDGYTLLPYVDRQGRTVDIRRVVYDTAEPALLPCELMSEWLHRELGFVAPPEPLCLYGEEMMAQLPKAVVGLVHDELEVLVGRLWRPDMAWVCLPHGTALRLTDPASLSILLPLAGRTVMLWPWAGRLAAAQHTVEVLAAQLHLRIAIPAAWQRALSGPSPPRSLAETILKREGPSPTLPKGEGERSR